ncbi:MAG: magnesium transporter [Polyangiales bacterium]
MDREELTQSMQLVSLIGPDLRRMLTAAQDPDAARELVEEFHPEDLADLLKDLGPEESAAILKLLPEDIAASIFERLEQGEQESILTLIGPEAGADIASEMAADDRAAFIENLPEEVGEKLLATLERVDPVAAEEARSLGRYEPGTAGSLMTTDYLHVSIDATVAQAIDIVRKHGEKVETVYYLFVLVGQNRLGGVVSLRDLLLADATVRISEVMTERIVTATPDVDQEEIARRMSKYDLLALPIVDTSGGLIGVITADDIMDVLTQEGTEDVQKLGGMEAIEDPYFATSFLTFIRKRASWLVILFVEEFFTGTALRHYDEVLQAVGKLAYYVPLLISTGGNSGSQSATLIIRGMAVGEIKTKDWTRIAWRELGMGVVMGCILAAVGVGRVLMWGDGWRFAALIALTLIGIVTMGCVVGSMLPIMLKRFGFDPATSSTPFIASLVDVMGIIIYFNIAKFLLRDVIEAAIHAHAIAH